MKVFDYLAKQDNRKRCLIVEDVAKGNKIIRRYEKETGQLVRNVSCKTIKQILQELYLYVSLDESSSDEKILNSGQALILFRKFMVPADVTKKDGEEFPQVDLEYFKDKNMLSMHMMEEIFHKVNLMRENYVEMTNPSGRIGDLMNLIDVYEQYLSDNGIKDDTSILKEMFAILQGWADAGELENQLKFIFDTEFSYLEEEQECFSELYKLANKHLVEGSGGQKVTMWEENPKLERLLPVKEKISFYKGYGAFNEASYIAYDIARNKYPLGTVAIMYMSDAQLPAIEAATKGNGLDAAFVSDYPIANNQLISLVKRILDWAKADFSEKELENIFASKILSLMEKDEDGNERNVIGGSAYYDYVLRAKNRRDNKMLLGWGYERNYEFMQHEKALDGQANLSALHNDLLSCFGKDGRADDWQRPIYIYEKIIEFIDKYVNKKSRDYIDAIGILRELKSIIALEKNTNEIEVCISFIENILEMVHSSEKESVNKILVQKMNSWQMLDREHIYVIGLALSDFSVSKMESPILTDAEMDELFKEGFSPTIVNRSMQNEINVRRTIDTFAGESLVFGYSDYNTVEFYANNPANIYREALKLFSNLSFKDIPEFVYGNPIAERQLQSQTGLMDRAKFSPKLKTSSSTMERFLDCPKLYAYEKLLYIPEEQYLEADYGNWLDAMNRGSFFHNVAEEYCKQKLIKSASEKYDAKCDEKLIDSLCEQEKNRLLAEIPVAFPELADQETEKMKLICKKFFQRVHDDFGREDNDWRVLMVEKEFANSIFKVHDLDGNEFDFDFGGKIDRIDYRIVTIEEVTEEKEEASEEVEKASDNNHENDVETEKKTRDVIQIRIIDYKTGNMKNKLAADKLGKLLQHAIYANAVSKQEDLINDIVTEIDRLENNTLASDYLKYLRAKNDNNQIAPDYLNSFVYLFPDWSDELGMHEIEAGSINGINMSRLVLQLTVMNRKQIFPDRYEVFQMLQEMKCELEAKIVELKLNIEEEKKELEGSEQEDQDNQNADKSDNEKVLERQNRLLDDLLMVYKAITSKDKLKDDEKKTCKYCQYSGLCSMRKAGL